MTAHSIYDFKHHLKLMGRTNTVSNSAQNFGDDVNKSKTGLLYHVREFSTNILSAVTLQQRMKSTEVQTLGALRMRCTAN